jgi:serine/threonine protein kinase
MGLVFAAGQRRLDRKVALKLLRPELVTAVAAERFLTEGRLLARLTHPNITTFQRLPAAVVDWSGGRREVHPLSA